LGDWVGKHVIQIYCICICRGIKACECSNAI